MSKSNRVIFIFFVGVITVCLSRGTAVADGELAVGILQQVAENLRVTDRIQYEIEHRFSFLPPVPPAGGFPGRHVDAVVIRDGNRIEVSGIERHYAGSRFIEEERIHQVSTPDFHVHATNRDDDPDAGMVTTQQVERLLAPLLISGNFGFGLDGYIGDMARFTELMLMEPDRVKFIGEKEANGVICLQIDADTKYGFFSVFVDEKNNYAIRRVVSVKGQSAILYAGDRYLQDMPNVETFTEVLDNLEFNLIDGINMPTKGTLTVTRRDRNGDIYMNKSEYVRTNINLNPVFGVDAFSTAFLEGELVSNLDDPESGVVYVWDGEQAVPAFTYFTGRAFMQGYAGFVRLFLMLLGIALIAYALYRVLRKKK